MDKRLTKGIVVIAVIILICVCIARGCTSFETVADYATSVRTHEDDGGADMQGEVAPSTGQMKMQQDSGPVPVDKVESSNSDVSEKQQDESGVQMNQSNDSSEQTNQLSLSPNEPQLVDDASTKTQLTYVSHEDIGEYFYIEEISDELKDRMNGKSYAQDIDESIVNYSMLRHVVILYNDFDDETQIGELVCNEKIADDLLDIFLQLYQSGYQLERVELIDNYDADDDASMDANNTSSFNYRVVDHTTKLSYHAYGLAIDINPFYNPYVQMRNGEEYVCPSGSVPYANREGNFPYKIDTDDLAYKLFKQHGFIWGGDWNNCKDYQHFEKRF